MRQAPLILWILMCLFGASPAIQAQPLGTLDLNRVATADGLIFRLSGSVGDGSAGVPVTGGFDLDNDGHNDFAMANFQAAPLSRTGAGQVFLVFGDGAIAGQIDTADPHPRVLPILGDQANEHAGSEIWMADVTGDGLGDLIICRQDYSLPGRLRAGALTLIPGQTLLRTLAANEQTIDLRSPPAELQITTILGATTGSRLCIWARSGDVTGDGTDDLLVGADREASHGESDSGAAYLFRGGSHLQSSQTIDLADFGSVIAGQVARIQPPTGSSNFHFGATVQIADLDGNGSAEVLIAAALNRAGAGIGGGEGSGGAPDGTLYIAWDDNFTGNWIPAAGTALDFVVTQGPGAHTSINGFAGKNDVFGEEILGGLDYDNDGQADLFVGDLTADGWGTVARNNAGTSHVIYQAQGLKGHDFDLQDGPFPSGFSMSTFIGPTPGAISGDTAMHGDFNGDGIADLAFSSPHDRPFGRINAGTLHIVLGRTGPWPALTDLAAENFPDPALIRIVEIYGAKGNGADGDTGDTLCYSGASGDMNGDGISDIITNEMEGNGTAPGAIDVGNLLLIDVRRVLDRVFQDGFESPDQEP